MILNQTKNLSAHPASEPSGRKSHGGLQKKLLPPQSKSHPRHKNPSKMNVLPGYTTLEQGAVIQSLKPDNQVKKP
ncbi:hypothetical protein PCASD_03013 [Puccinia coronata f. sp. avenae]|uniref:Uncharacterized protein n=1 Tax=Puccinia coronata f. sp. avenae TaxID=200324 RepID=A0A2N5VGR3_9BASI|nr:hypothetical protein PCASD_03013 [Puccinia coronata f. sp. avenae]